MVRPTIVVILVCLLVFTACGSTAPPTAMLATATTLPTVVPTATATTRPTFTPTPRLTPTRPRPTPTATVPPTIAPSPTIARLPVTLTGNEQTGRCQVGLPDGFRPDGQIADTWLSADRLVSASLGAIEPTTATIDEALKLVVARVSQQVTALQETGRDQGPGYRRIDFRGMAQGQPAWGSFYVRQFGLDFCQVTLIATSGTTLLLDPVFATMIDTLIAVNPRPAPVGYLALGDSYAVGVGASAPAERGYTAIFAATLRSRSKGPYTYRNLAVSGQTTADFLGDWDRTGRDGTSQLAGGVRALTEGSITVVTLDIGGNDILRLVKPGQPCAGDKIEGAACLAAMQENLRTMTTPNMPRILRALAEAAPAGTQIMVLTYPNPFATGKKSAAAERSEVAMRELNAIIAGAVRDLAPAASARQITLTLVDPAPLFDGKAATLTHITDTPPDIHLTDAGYAILASAVEKSYRPAR